MITGLVGTRGFALMYRCHVSDSEAIDGGGALDVYRCRIELKSCTITRCKAGTNGGAISLVDSSAKITDCTLSSNRAGLRGGAVHTTGEGNLAWLLRLDLSLSTLVSNSADGLMGGAILVARSNAHISSCTFKGNSVPGHGGAVALETGVPGISVMLTKCLLSDNKATHGQGGGIHMERWKGHAELNSCTLSNNSAGQCGGAISLVQMQALSTFSLLCLLDNKANSLAHTDGRCKHWRYSELEQLSCAGGGAFCALSADLRLIETVVGPNSQPWILLSRSDMAMNGTVLLNMSSLDASRNSACGNSVLRSRNAAQEALVGLQLNRSSIITYRSEIGADVQADDDSYLVQSSVAASQQRALRQAL